MIISLNITIAPYRDGADLVVNGRHYTLSPETINTPADLNTLLGGEPEYVRVAVVGLLHEAATV